MNMNPQNPDNPEGVEQPTRRSLLTWVILFFTSLSALIIGVPLLRFLFPPERVIEKRGRKTFVARIKDIQKGRAKTVLYENSPVLLINYGGSIRAVSAICTHMGCFLRWDDRAGQIKCPCHYAAFDIDGEVLSGPPPRPLKTFKVEVTHGKIFIVKD